MLFSPGLYSKDNAVMVLFIKFTKSQVKFDHLIDFLNPRNLNTIIITFLNHTFRIPSSLKNHFHIKINS